MGSVVQSPDLPPASVQASHRLVAVEDKKADFPLMAAPVVTGLHLTLCTG